MFYLSKTCEEISEIFFLYSLISGNALMAGFFQAACRIEF